MLPNRKQAHRPKAARSQDAPAPKPAAATRAGRAQMFGDAGQNVEDEKKRTERTPEPQNHAPTVGKTGGRGARAERPSEGSDRKQASAPPVEVTRNSKPPAETPKATAKHGKPNASAR
jgi:hypothetical protein